MGFNSGFKGLNKQNATTLPTHSSHGLRKTHQDGKSEFASQSHKNTRVVETLYPLPYIKTVNKLQNDVSPCHELLRYLSPYSYVLRLLFCYAKLCYFFTHITQHRQILLIGSRPTVFMDLGFVSLCIFIHSNE